MAIIIGMSLDGFVADASGDVAPLYPDLVQGSMKDNELVQESIESTGAVVMGRGAYDMAEGNFTEYEYQVPIFVLTHHPPDEVPEGQSEGGLACARHLGNCDIPVSVVLNRAPEELSGAAARQYGFSTRWAWRPTSKLMASPGRSDQWSLSTRSCGTASAAKSEPSRFSAGRMSIVYAAAEEDAWIQSDCYVELGERQ